jgi:hypothetical protein
MWIAQLLAEDESREDENVLRPLAWTERAQQGMPPYDE